MTIQNGDIPDLNGKLDSPAPAYLAGILSGENVDGMIPDEVCEIFLKNGLDGILYYFTGGRLPEKYREIFFSRYQNTAAISLKREYFLKEICDTLEQAGCAYCRLKGADLAYSVYPSPTLRPGCDWDILVRAEDTKTAEAALRKQGWSSPYHYTHEHHLPYMTRMGTVLELHFNLPGFPDDMQDRIWHELIPGKGMEYTLPPELNILMLFQHSFGHDWINGLRLLTDVILLTRNHSIDPDELERYRRLFRLGDPRMLFDAFPECFPGNRKNEPDQALRFLILRGQSFASRAREIAARDLMRLSVKTLRESLSGLTFSAVRLKYRLPEGSWGQVCRHWCSELVMKIALFVKFALHRPDRQLNEYLEQRKIIEGKMKRLP